MSSERFWRDRATLVTGATGLVGSALVARLRQAGAGVVCLVRDWVPQSELGRSRAIERVRVVLGDVRDQALLERVLGGYEVRPLFYLAPQTIVPIANRNPVATHETNGAAARGRPQRPWKRFAFPTATTARALRVTLVRSTIDPSGLHLSQT